MGQALDSRDLRARLRRHYNAAVKNGRTLAEELDAAFETLGDAALPATGQHITATSGNGHQVQFSDPGEANGPTSEYRALEEIISTVEDATTALGDGATDAEIYTEARHRLTGATTAHPCFSGILR